jgi:hypothetical protein
MILIQKQRRWLIPLSKTDIPNSSDWIIVMTFFEFHHSKRQKGLKWRENGVDDHVSMEDFSKRSSKTESIAHPCSSISWMLSTPSFFSPLKTDFLCNYQIRSVVASHNDPFRMLTGLSLCNKVLNLNLRFFLFYFIFYFAECLANKKMMVILAFRTNPVTKFLHSIHSLAPLI